MNKLQAIRAVEILLLVAMTLALVYMGHHAQDMKKTCGLSHPDGNQSVIIIGRSTIEYRNLSYPNITVPANLSTCRLVCDQPNASETSFCKS